MGLTDFAALEALLHKGPLTIAEIQAKVPLALGSMTAAVDRLEKKGFIIRTPAPEIGEQGVEVDPGRKAHRRSGIQPARRGT